MFIGGISQETTEARLTNYFESFGTIGNVTIVYDKVTKASKGFGFIKCENVKVAKRILASKPHMIDGRVVEVSEAVGRETLTCNESIGKGFRRLFVGGLSSKTNSSRRI